MGCQWQDGDPPINFYRSSGWWAMVRGFLPTARDSSRGRTLSRLCQCMSPQVFLAKTMTSHGKKSELLGLCVIHLGVWRSHLRLWEEGRVQSWEGTIWGCFLSLEELQSGQFLNAGGIWPRKTAAQEFVKEATWVDRLRSSGKDRAPSSGAARDPTQLGHFKADY